MSTTSDPILAALGHPHDHVRSVLTPLEFRELLDATEARRLGAQKMKRMPI
ncbi:MAG: hypothetical protein WBO17_01305 [Sphingorhabdus sp.]